MTLTEQEVRNINLIEVRGAMGVDQLTVEAERANAHSGVARRFCVRMLRRMGDQSPTLPRARASGRLRLRNVWLIT